MASEWGICFALRTIILTKDSLLWKNHFVGDAHVRCVAVAVAAISVLYAIETEWAVYLCDFDWFIADLLQGAGMYIIMHNMKCGSILNFIIYFYPPCISGPKIAGSQVQFGVKSSDSGSYDFWVVNNVLKNLFQKCSVQNDYPKS